MKNRVVFLLLIILVVPGVIQSVEQVRIKHIIDDPYRFRDDTVIVEGGITQYGEEKTKFSKYYYIKGDWGGIIKVITDLDWPKVNERYEIRGIVGISDKSEVFIFESSRSLLSDAIEIPGEVTDGKGKKKWLYYLIGGAGFLLILVVILAIAMATSRKKSDYITPIGTGFDFSSELGDLPEPANVIEGSTIKMSAPPPGTLKLLPGRFEVVSGDETIKEIRFYKAKDKEESEITFGRGSGPDYSHIQLKPQTVSTKQAKLIWTNDEYTLINYSDVNPTIANDQPLSKEGSVALKEGDKIEMGEIIFIFHEK